MQIEPMTTTTALRNSPNMMRGLRLTQLPNKDFITIQLFKQVRKQKQLMYEFIVF